MDPLADKTEIAETIRKNKMLVEIYTAFMEPEL